MKNNKVPEIRFSGFDNEWELRKLGDLVVDISRPLKMLDDTFYQLVTVKRRNEGVVSRGIFKGLEVLVKTQFTIKSGDYLISKRQVVHGANGIVPDYLDGAIVSNEYLVLNGTDDLSVDFLSIISELPSMYKKFFLSSYGIDIEKLVFNVPDWKKRKILVPSIAEQNKIISYFKVINNTIVLHQHELNNLKQTKQGFLQKMFPKESELVPELRFPGFTDEWEQRKLAEISKIVTGSTPSTSKDEFYDGDLLFVSPADIQGNRYVDSTKTTLSEIGFSKGRKIRSGSTLFVSIGSTIGKVAQIRKDVVTNQQINSVIGNKEMNNDFIFSILEKEASLIRCLSSTQAVPIINKNTFSNINIMTPNFEEQSKIGNFFKQLDDMIALHQRELEALKETKKAFLQKMFI